MQPFDYYKPTTFDEAFKLLTLPDKSVYPLAGGTDLIPHAREAIWRPDVVVDIKALPGLRDIAVDPSGTLFVGAAMKMNEIACSAVVRSHWDILAQGAAAMGNEQVRNRATLGGNLGTASPVADSAPALYVLEAEVVVRGPQGERAVPVADFFVGPKANALQPGDIIVGVRIPPLPVGTVGVYEKLSRRKAGDLAVVSSAVLAIPTDEAGRYRWRIALGAVAPTPLRAPQAEAILNAGVDEASIAKAAAEAYGCCCPIDDVRASALYRQAMVVTITKRAVRGVLAKMRDA